MQIIVIVWAAISAVLALALVTSMSGTSLFGIPWASSVLMFFVFLLFVLSPVYLLLYSWYILSDRDT
jgi:hypothetical protein